MKLKTEVPFVWDRFAVPNMGHAIKDQIPHYSPTPQTLCLATINRGGPALAKPESQVHKLTQK